MNNYNKNIPAYLPRRSAWFLSAVLPAALLFIFCSDLVNPFEDKSNSTAVISSQFSKSDTTEIFKSETLTVRAAVFESIDSICCISAKNIYWNRKVMTIPHNSSNSPEWKIPVSFYDTGHQQINIETHRKNGQTIEDIYDIYCVSPLSQDSVAGDYDKEILLSADGVFDENVHYHWDFTKSVIHSTRPQKSVIITDALSEGTGRLWVSDAPGDHSSPWVLFYYNFTDTIGPSVTCLNKGYSGKDTLISPDSSFLLMISVSDRGSRLPSNNILINGEESDIVDSSNINETICLKAIYGLDNSDEYIRVLVRAEDNCSPPNISDKYFWVTYDPSIDIAGQAVRLAVQNPSTDSTTVGKRDIYVFGFVDNYTSNNLSLSVSVNDSVYPDLKEISGLHTYWGWKTSLSSDTNLLSFSLCDPEGIIIVDTQYTVIFDSSSVDNEPPLILDISPDNYYPEYPVVEVDNIGLQITAFDRVSEITGVTVADESAELESTGEGYTWSVSGIELKHGRNVLTVKVHDSEGNIAEESVIIFRNRKPELFIPDTISQLIPAGSQYNVSYAVYDPDGDDVSAEFTGSQQGLSYSCDDSLSISWTPHSDNLGLNHLTFILDDSFSTSVETVTVHVIDSSGTYEAVNYDICESSFPASLYADLDTMDILLETTEGSGVHPLEYSALRFRETETESLSVIDGRLIWIPDSSDTGINYFSIIVTDYFGRSDTLSPSCMVLTPPPPLELGFYTNTTMADDSTMDLSGSTGTDTLWLFYTNISAGPPECRLNISLLNSETQLSLNNDDSIMVTINSQLIERTRDTLQIKAASVNDTLEFSLYLFCGGFPVPPFSPEPEQNDTFTVNPVSLSWSDSGSDSLYYLVYLDTTPSLSSPVDTVDTAYYMSDSLENRETYYWQIKAIGKKGESTSPVWMFHTGFPIDTNGIQIKMNTTANGAVISENIYNFPLLVRLTADNFVFSSDSDSSGISFVKPDGAALPFEIDQWDIQNSISVFWVKVDTVYGNDSSQYINLLINDSSAQKIRSSVQVFDTADGFAGVWHMNSGIEDATYGQNDGEDNGTTDISGNIGRARDFIYNDYINIAYDVFNGLDQQITVSLWQYGDENQPEQDYIFDGRSYNDTRQITSNLPDYQGYIQWYCGNGSSYGVDNISGYAQSDMYEGTWNHWVFTKNVQTGNMRIYYNGTEWHSSPNQYRDFSRGISSFSIGSQADGGSNFYSGSIDEFRISTIERSASWIKLSYENQKNGSGFLSFDIIN